MLDLVAEGWNHLHLQRPLAAWAAWQRVLRTQPGSVEASEALEHLANAVDLPAASRAVYRFQAPKDPERRKTWDQTLRDAGNLDDLGAALEAFRTLSERDPNDADAWLNRALVLAWFGRNVDAVDALEQVVRILAAEDPARAAEAWTLAEVLRLGAGAEALCDDFRYSWTISWSDSAGSIDAFLSRWPNLVPANLARVTSSDNPELADTQVFEWLDRPLDPATSSRRVRAEELPIILAILIRTPGSLRLSSPDRIGLAQIGDEPRYGEILEVLSMARREMTPLSLARADSALATYKLPPNIDADEKAALSRSVVELYFETRWIHQPRKSLDGRTPLEASRAATGGDRVATAKLSGVVRFREQLGSRPNMEGVYQGYPFDRLRRRLGLIEPTENPGSLDPLDFSCMSERELDRLELDTLDDSALAEAFQSAIAFRDDFRVARIAAAIADRNLRSLAAIDLRSVFAPLVRQALKANDPRKALAWLELAANSTDDDELKRTFTVWSAEVNARVGNPRDSLKAYLSLTEKAAPALAATIARDGAETLKDNGYLAEAEILDAIADGHAKPSNAPVDR